MTRFPIRAVAPAAAQPISEMGEPEGPGAIRANSRHIERDGRPWVPVMAEYHFSRDVREHWRDELLKLKAGGVNVVATYMLWILHEERRGEVRWDGSRDVRRFVELAGEVGLDVVLRIGPWAHGETRNGGYPDWLQALDIRHRTDDPAYLELATEWYRQVFAQTQGLFRDAEHPDAPIVGIQVENELYDQRQHLATLRRIAEEIGFTAPLWTATGWGGAQLPPNLMPVYAGYSDGFWEESDVLWPAFGEMHFTYNAVRDDLSVGADLRTFAAAELQQDTRYPYVTCELGGGMTVAYHRRPLVEPTDVAALALTKLGSGSVWQGYYLYHGAHQVIGEDSTTQESHETGYPNDVPVRDYDFYAPVGAHGQLRPHYHALRLQHLLLEQYGDRLAVGEPVFPEPGAAVRYAFRGDRRGGFLFFNNHQPAAAPLEAVPDVQFEVELDGRTVTVPRTPVTIPSSAFAAWPVEQRIAGVDGVTITAQPITEQGSVAVLLASDGVPVELQLPSGREVAGAELVADEDGRATWALTAAPGPDARITIDGGATLIVLDAASAADLWCGTIAGRDLIVLSADPLLFDGDRLRAIRSDAQPSSLRVLETAGDARWREVPVPGGLAPVELDVVASRPAASTAPERRGGSSNRLSAPRDEDFADAAVFEIALDDALLTGADRALVEIDWTGDVARAVRDGQLIGDQFWYGRRWDLDVTAVDGAAGGSLTVHAFPWKPSSTAFVDPGVRPSGDVPTLEIRSATLRRHRSVDVEL